LLSNGAPLARYAHGLRYESTWLSSGFKKLDGSIFNSLSFVVNQSFEIVFWPLEIQKLGKYFFFALFALN